MCRLTSTIVLLTLTVIALIQQVPHVDSANILGLFTSKSASHLIIHMSVVKALAEKGHNVTVVCSLEPVVTHPAIRVIVIPPKEEYNIDLEKHITEMANQKNTIVSIFKFFTASKSPLVDMQLDMLKDERFQALYEPANKFDLVIMGYFMNDFQVGVARKFNCPIIIDWMTVPNELINEYVGNPNEISYVPNIMLPLEVGKQMTFRERLQNLMTSLFIRGIKFFINAKMERYYAELFLDDPNFPSLDEMKKNVSLVFCNSHFSEGPIRPNVPALIEIGGIQAKEKPDPLPEDIAKFLDESKKHGAILFSLGSNLQGSNVNPNTIQVIYKALSSLKQNVIWKWDKLDKTPGSSPNIIYKKWMPQDDILAHPNLKLFITHAGKGGIAEAQYHGVPMVALPVFADQHANAAKMTTSGYGLYMDFLQLTEDSLKGTIMEVLSNPSYANSVKKYSKLYRDRPFTPKETVVFWTEYVLRHHGATHMQSPLVYMNSIQSSNLDVIAFILLIVYLVWRVIKLIVCGVQKLLRKLKKPKNKKVKKQ